ncbi:class I SAM-dependent methyltransferase [Botryobacter ruber]|uniref:class I SAM-dependent methyltransferase n=1 Tax=Botryobacter ruber TaxID=2171629 RepID=UPI000E0C8195|nr:class I SAM-dependent methyltransferase [Botryobacter ruber]
MYEVIKNSTKQVLPRKYLLYGENLIRSIIFQFYKGDKFQCTVCEKKLRKFISLLTNHDKLCPNCGSRSRDRRLWLMLRPFLLDNISVLHFSPARCLSKKLKNYPGIQYHTADLKGKFPADKKLDITNIEEPSGTFDMIICYHVLEHIEDDKKAMQELNRVLRVGGKCFIQTPFKKGMIYEDWDKRTSAARKKHFGNRNHVRIYSVDGLKARLQNTGFDVVATKFVEKKDNYFGLQEEEYVVTGLKH